MKMERIWRNKYNLLRLTWEAFVCEFKDKGNGYKEFSTKKFFAFIFSMLLGVINHTWLIFNPETHWTVILANAGVSGTVIAVAMGTMDVLIVGALTVYGWSKSKNAS